MTTGFSRLHGRKGAIGLFALSLIFSFFSAFHFDLTGDDVVDIFHPIIHTKDLLARKLADATQRDDLAIPSLQWELAYDQQEDYRDCLLNQPRERPQHGCVTDPDTRIPYCQVRNLRIDTSKISGPMGGEQLETVMGRHEDIEIPKYLPGAFSTAENLNLAPNMSRDFWFYLLEVFMAMDVNRRQKCETVLSGVSLIITRYEYVDMYHSLKDWWNAFLALPDGIEKVDRVIFLDSHAHGYLDSVWADLFGPTIHVKMIPEGTCLDHAIFVPPGYSSVLNPLGRMLLGNRCAAMSQAFVQFVIRRYNLENIEKQDKSVLILDQLHHIDHPRSAPEEQIDNSVLSEMHSKLLDQTEATSVQVIDMHRLSFKAQLKLIRQAHILIGYKKQGSVEGSQLALLMFLQDGAHLMEIRETSGDMQNIVRWRPEVKYIPVYSPNVGLVDYEIVPTVKDILTPGWDNGVRRFPDSYYERASMGPRMDDRFETGMDPNEDEMMPENILQGWDSFQSMYDKADNYRECALFGPSKRPSHGCIVDAETKIPFCALENLRIDSSKIESSLGGESVESVLGRVESDEFPKYLEGALTVTKDIDLPATIDRSMFYYLDDVFNSISTDPSQKCLRTESTTTLFITRYEYVDLAHSLSDLWNAFMVLPEEFPNDIQVVFLDAHAEGFLDSLWENAFTKFDRVKQLPEGGVCYERAIFIPPGYSSTLFPRKRIFLSKPCPSMTNAFVDFIVKSYSLQNEVVDQGRVTILDRVPFVSHPRSDPGHEKQAVSNLDELKKVLEQKTNATEVEIVDLAQISFREQLRVMRRSHIIIGVSEAGISHLIFMQEGTHVFELGSMHIASTIARWKLGLTCRSFDDFLPPLSSEESLVLDQEFIAKYLIPAVQYAINKQDEMQSVPESVE